MEYFSKEVKVEEIIFLERCCNFKFRKCVIGVVSNLNTLHNPCGVMNDIQTKTYVLPLKMCIRIVMVEVGSRVSTLLFTLQGGKTALEIANHWNVVKALLENDASVNEKDEVSIFTVLRVNEKFVFRSHRSLCRREDQTTSLLVVSLSEIASVYTGPGSN